MEPITDEDLGGVLGIDETGILRCGQKKMGVLHRKVEAAFPPESRNHVVSCRDYDTLYVTSDIHSDLQKFVQMLSLNRLLGFTDVRTLNPYDVDQLYSLEWLSKVKWTGGERTLLVIVGDLIDGRRDHSPAGQKGTYVNNPVDDIGISELVLLILLYNLRISAKSQRSEILFTMGNHELVSVILPQKYAFDEFATENTRVFFGDSLPFADGSVSAAAMAHRSSVLVPFLNMSPYYMIRMENEGTQEIAFVHGGLHRKSGSHLDALEALQRRINRPGGTLAMIRDSPLLEGGEGPLWLRDYAQTEGGACDLLTPSPLLTMVGHCVTGGGFERFTELLEKPLYAGCSKTHEVGCVLADCNDAKGAPRLLFVDTGSGKSQRSPRHGAVPEIPNEHRLAQMIKCTHHADLAGDRYFNQIERVAKADAGGHSLSGLSGPGDTTVLFKALPKGAAPPPANAAAGAPKPAVVKNASGFAEGPFHNWSTFPALARSKAAATATAATAATAAAAAVPGSVEAPFHNWSSVSVASGSPKGSRRSLPSGWGAPPPAPAPAPAPVVTPIASASAGLPEDSPMSQHSPSKGSRRSLPSGWGAPPSKTVGGRNSRNSRNRRQHRNGRKSRKGQRKPTRK